MRLQMKQSDFQFDFFFNFNKKHNNRKTKTYFWIRKFVQSIKNFKIQNFYLKNNSKKEITKITRITTNFCFLQSKQINETDF